MKSHFPLFSIVLLSFTITGCFGTSANSHFHQLTPPPRPPCAEGRKSTPVTVGVGPISLPTYLDRSSIVRRDESSEILVSDFDFWIEPISEALVRTITIRLSAGAEDLCLTAIPWSGLVRFDYQLVSDILRFDCTKGEDCTMEARWYLRKRGRQLPIPPQVFSATTPLAESSSVLSGEISALTTLTELYSEEIFLGIRDHLLVTE